MSADLLTGELVRLSSLDAQTFAEAVSRWSHDSEYFRLLGTEPSRPYSIQATKEWFEANLGKNELTNFEFGIRTLEGDQLIGETGLMGRNWIHGDMFVGIGIGEREFWSKGYGSDAMRLILRFAFRELNLHRVSLDVFEYNQRAIRSYEKVGFVMEGRARQFLHREGRRWDLIYMGILREEWFSRYGT
jgi:RimJ/RimL family protein N-acetyltransferase